MLGRLWQPARIPGSATAALGLMLGNFYIARHGWKFQWASPLWSLSVEEQFYLWIPAVVRIGGRTRRLLVGTCLGLVPLAYVALFYLADRGAAPIVGIWVNSVVQFQFFAAGALVAVWHHGRQFCPGPVVRFVLAAAAVAGWWAAASLCQLHSWTAIVPGRVLMGYVLVLAATCCFFLAALDLAWAFPKWLVYLGKITYGLYVFHFIFISIATSVSVRAMLTTRVPGTPFLAAAAATVCMGALSYRYLETPFLRLKARFEHIPTRAV